MTERPWFRHWPKGLPTSLEYPRVPVYAFLESSARRFPDRDAIVFLDVPIKYRELWDLARRFARALADLGVGRGDVVAVHLPNIPQFPIAYYGILMAGAVFSPCSPLLSPRELEYQLNDCDAKVLVTMDLFLGNVQAALGQTGVRHVIVTGLQEALPPFQPLDARSLGDGFLSFRALLEAPPDPPAVAIDPDHDLAHLAYTGGTTGLPKGVMLTHRNVVVNVLQYAHWSGGGRPVYEDGTFRRVDVPEPSPGEPWEFPGREGQERLVVVVPWFHAMGTIGYLNIPIYGAATIIPHPRFDPNAYLDAAEKYEVTQIGGAPPLFVALFNQGRLAERRLPSVRFIGSGAAPLAVEVLHRLRETFPDAVVVEGYGLTEVTMGATMNPANRSGLRKPGSVGIPVFDTEVKVVDPATGRECGPDEAGEVWIRGPQVMKGYYKRPEATAEVLTPDGWLRTGDIGRMDEDGYLYIVDRIKDMLIYKGYNVYPRELEEILYQHPAVAHCAVIGKPVPEVGEIPKAFVVLREGAQATAEELMAFVAERVAAYKRIREVEFVPELPVSLAGKVLKRELRARELERARESAS